jgi:hypothetical protein
MNNNKFLDVISSSQFNGSHALKCVLSAGGSAPLHEQRDEAGLPRLGGMMQWGASIRVECVYIRPEVEQFHCHLELLRHAVEHSVVEGCAARMILDMH